MMYSANKLNKQGDNIKPLSTPFPIWNQSVVPCPVLNVASWQCSCQKDGYPGFGHKHFSLHFFIILPSRCVWFTHYSFAVVQPLSCVQFFATPWIAVHQASLSFTISQSLLKLMSIESVMSSSHLILCCPLEAAVRTGHGTTDWF